MTTDTLMKGRHYPKGRWYGFDVDGTISDNSLHGWEIGAPIPPMVRLMKELHANGYDVRILSGRLGDYECDAAISDYTKEHIWAWCDRHLGFRPELTGRKDSMMETLYDDRACQVVCNQGVPIEDVARELAKALDGALENPEENRERLAALRNRCRELGLL